MLQKAQAELRKGSEPTLTLKLYYEDLRQILLDDYKDKGKLVMDGEDPVITGRRGSDDVQTGSNVSGLPDCSR
jgi:hypothetical protein